MSNPNGANNCLHLDAQNRQCRNAERGRREEPKGGCMLHRNFAQRVADPGSLTVVMTGIREQRLQLFVQRYRLFQQSLKI